MQCFGPTCTMRTRYLSAVLTCVYLLLVKCLALRVFQDSRRIINGMTAEPSEFPFLVRLEGSWGRICGATVIGNFFVLTGAHCIWDIECQSIKLLPSTWRKDESHEFPPFHIDTCYLHEMYLPTELAYDIALVKTHEDILEGGTFQSIPLPEPGTIYIPGTKALIAGFGKTEEGKWSDRLLMGLVMIESWDYCNWKFREIDSKCVSQEDCPVKDIPRRSLCTHTQAAWTPAVCFGDSGGPLVIDEVVAGIIYGTIVHMGVCENDSPTLHTSVIDYLPWIYHIIEPTRDTSHMHVTLEAVREIDEENA